MILPSITMFCKIITIHYVYIKKSNEFQVLYIISFFNNFSDDDDDDDDDDGYYYYYCYGNDLDDQ